MKDRILELRRVPARTLKPNPKNWRTHPPEQREVLLAMLHDIGYAAALIARQLPDGSLELIDGHLRAETTPDAIVPVLVLDVTAEEADKLLATIDPLSAMAGVDAEAAVQLQAALDFKNVSVECMFRNLLQKAADGIRGWEAELNSQDALGDKQKGVGSVLRETATPSENAQPKNTPDPIDAANKPPREVNILTLFQLVVQCRDETQQRELYEQLTAAGYVCKVMTL